jgi:hypothetical protein
MARKQLSKKWKKAKYNPYVTCNVGGIANK